MGYVVNIFENFVDHARGFHVGRKITADFFIFVNITYFSCFSVSQGELQKQILKQERRIHGNLGLVRVYNCELQHLRRFSHYAALVCFISKQNRLQFPEFLQPFV